MAEILEKAQPCPYCGNTEVNIKINYKCENSNAECKCTNCSAYIQMYSSIKLNYTLHNCIGSLKEEILERWNNSNTEIEKKTVLKLKRKHVSNNKGVLYEITTPQSFGFSIKNSNKNNIDFLEIKGDDHA